MTKRVDISKFINTTEESAYFLGLHYADGYLSGNPKRGYTVGIKILFDDGNSLIDIFKKLGDIIIYIRTPKNRRKVIEFLIYNIDIFNFLVKYGYLFKSMNSPTKILNFIPKQYHNLFWRGYFDGDGYITKNLDRIGFCGSYNQSWQDLENLLKSLNINDYKIKRTIKSTGKQSYLEFYSKKSKLIFKNFIYNNSNTKFGILRKQKLLNII